MLVLGNWMCGSWGEKGTKQIPASIAVNLASVADTKLKSRSPFLCRPSTQSFTVFTSLKRIMVWFYVFPELVLRLSQTADSPILAT